MRVLVGTAATAIVVLAGTELPAVAQGCILLRQTSPMLGTTGTLGQEVGTWNVTFTARNSTADIHYNGTERQRQREIEQTYVVNRQNSITATVSYQMTPRVSLNVGVPLLKPPGAFPRRDRGGRPPTPTKTPVASATSRRWRAWRCSTP